MRFDPPVWLSTTNPEGLRLVLREYRFFVHRFPQWLALLIGRVESESVQRLLLPNLVEELGGLNGRPSHQALLARCLTRAGVEEPSLNTVLPSTKEVEAWFMAVFDGADTYRALCTLGPGTEAVSPTFLQPLEMGLWRCFGPDGDYDYFGVHRGEAEVSHARNINVALALLEAGMPGNALALRERVTREAWAAHARFWEGVRAALPV